MWSIENTHGGAHREKEDAQYKRKINIHSKLCWIQVYQAQRVLYSIKSIYLKEKRKTQNQEFRTSFLNTRKIIKNSNQIKWKEENNLRINQLKQKTSNKENEQAKVDGLETLINLINHWQYVSTKQEKI